MYLWGVFTSNKNMKKLLLSLAAMTAFTTVSAQKLLVLYYSETGTTKTVAQEMQKQLGADIEAIECVKPYSGNFQETIQRGQREMQSGEYPALKAGSGERCSALRSSRSGGDAGSLAGIPCFFRRVRTVWCRWC